MTPRQAPRGPHENRGGSGFFRAENRDRFGTEAGRAISYSSKNRPRSQRRRRPQTLATHSGFHKLVSRVVAGSPVTLSGTRCTARVALLRPECSLQPEVAPTIGTKYACQCPKNASGIAWPADLPRDLFVPEPASCGFPDTFVSVSRRHEKTPLALLLKTRLRLYGQAPFGRRTSFVRSGRSAAGIPCIFPWPQSALPILRAQERCASRSRIRRTPCAIQAR